MIGSTFSPAKARLRLVDVPLHHLAVDEQGRVGVAAPVKGGVQRAEADLRLRHDHVALLDLVVEQIVKLAHVDDA